MKLRLCLFALGLLFVCAATVHADGIPPGDPEIIVGEGTGSFVVTSLPFSFAIPGDTTGCTVNGLSGVCFDSFNNTGGTIGSLVITFPTAVTNVTCLALSFFATCTPSGNNAIYTGGTGIPQTHFFIFLQTGFPDGTYTVSTVPEPATLGLLATGLSAIFAGRKLRKRAASRT